VTHSMCGSGARWCARADAIFDVLGMHVLDVNEDVRGRLVLTVESDQVQTGCPSCGVVVISHGRRPRTLHDAPCLGRITVLRWLKRLWRCREPDCPTGVFSETHEIAPARAVLTVRAVRWATDALTHDDTTVSALARQLGVDWHTAWNAIELEAKARTSNPQRLAGVKTLGVDEHIWRPSRIGVDRAVTIIVDLSRDQAGCLHARLLDAVVGRSGSAYKGWLKAQPDGFIDGVEQAALDPFRGYANAIGTACRTPSPCSTPSTSSGSERRWSTRCGSACNKTHSATAAVNMTLSIRSADSCATALNTSPSVSKPRSVHASTPATPQTR
jgi:transposase